MRFIPWLKFPWNSSLVSVWAGMKIVFCNPWKRFAGESVGSAFVRVLSHLFLLFNNSSTRVFSRRSEILISGFYDASIFMVFHMCHWWMIVLPEGTWNREKHLHFSTGTLDRFLLRRRFCSASDLLSWPSSLSQATPLFLIPWNHFVISNINLHL